MSLTHGLRAHWTFDTGDIAGDVLRDRSGNANHAEIKGDITLGEPSPVGEAAWFNGKNTHLHIPHSESIDISGEELSISCWERFESGDNQKHTIISKNPSEDWNSGGGWSHGHSEDNELYYCIGDNETPKATGVTSSIEQWEHYVVTYDASVGETRLYQNGSLVESWEISGVVGSNTEDLYIGKFHHPNPNRDFYKGCLADIRLYDRVLSENDISHLFNMRTNRHHKL